MAVHPEPPHRPEWPDAAGEAGQPGRETVPVERWAEVCERIENRHRGWLVRIEALRPGADGLGRAAASETAAEDGGEDVAETLAADLPLRELKLKEPRNEPQIHLIVGRHDGKEVRLLLHPRTIVLEHGPSGHIAGLCIEDAAGDGVQVSFRTAPAPETVDGLGPEEI